MEVESYSRSIETESCGWWGADIKIIRGEFLVVGYSLNCTEIVDVTRVRMKNTQPPIDERTFYKFEIEVPEDLRE